MTWEDRVIESFKEHDVRFVAYIPDSVLSDLVAELNADDYFDTTLVSREEEAVGVLSGAWLGGTRGALVCQSSGIANSFNALGSLSKPNGIPFLGVVTRRGDLDEHNIAHAATEYPMPRLLDEIGVKNHRVSSPETIGQYVEMAGKSAFLQEEPYVLLLEPTIFKEEA
jgi:sulfopyruvate decarboxylase alpha subunit